MKSVLVLLCLTVYVSGHICLISPPQRVSLDRDTLTTRGASACIQLEAPCGSKEYPGQSKGIFSKGEKATIVFQKNLDHYNGKSDNEAGYFQAAILDENSEPYVIGKIYDSSNIKTLDNVALNVTMPYFSSRVVENVLQLTYVPRNDNAPQVFYQCADIIIQ